MNRATLLGNVTRDVELMYSKKGIAVAKTAIAVNNRRDGTTMFMEIVFFAGLAETANQYVKKGDKICIGGRIDFNQWVSQNGENKSKHTIIVQDLEMLGSKKAQTIAESNHSKPDFPDSTFDINIEDFDEIPF
jgi:single-strand DNA-binding protein